MRISSVPVMHCEKMAGADMSFRQRAVIEFLMKGKLGRSHLRAASHHIAQK
jgi:hypothetical protein